MEKLQKNKGNLTYVWVKQIKKYLSIIAIGYLFIRVVPVINSRWSAFTGPNYTEDYYQYVSDLFSRSQYRVKESPVILPDETVFSYASGAYIKGVDPILINSEHTPLAKYIIGVGIMFLSNDSVMSLLFYVLLLAFLFVLSKRVINDTSLSVIAVALFGSETLMINQLIYTPLLDLFHITFVIAALVAYLCEYRMRSFFPITAIMIGAVAASKTVVPAFIIVVAILIHLQYLKNWHRIGHFLISLVFSAAVFLLSYIRTFMNGYTFSEFVGFQKWIILYYSHKIAQPLAAWSLIYANRMKTWWGDRSELQAVDWQITWPIITTLTIIVIIRLFKNRQTGTNDTLFLAIYCFLQLIFISIGEVVSRYFLYLFPVFYILSVWLLSYGYYEKKISK